MPCHSQTYVFPLVQCPGRLLQSKQLLVHDVLHCDDAYCARRSLFIRSVTTRPSAAQLKSMAPPSSFAIPRCINLLPKPPRVTGAATGGPPRSVHVIWRSASPALQDTSSVPL